MNKEELISRIKDANYKYRIGSPVMGDVEYDELVELFQREYPDEYDDFRDTLNEGGIGAGPKIVHKHIAGSLDKLKYEAAADVRKFISKSISTTLNVSAKVDGLSGIAKYVDGKLATFATRGDGEIGCDITDKAEYVKGLPKEISNKSEIYVRGELVILKADFGKVDGTAARNIVSGLINRKEWSKDEIGNISFIAYTILGPDYSKAEQFDMLTKLGFDVAWNNTYPSDFYKASNIADKLFDIAMQEFPYETDGLVLSDSTYHNEDRKRPINQKAFKTNMMTAETRLIDISWEGPSKDGQFVGVGLVEPVVLGDATISRVTLHNLDFIDKNDLKYGSRVKISRSGDVIPKLIKNLGNDDKCKDIVFPDVCPCCGTKLVRGNLNFFCPNSECADQVNHQLTDFIRKLGVKSISNATLKNFNIKTYDDLIAFKPNPKYKTEVKLYSELLDKVFTKSRKDLVSALNFNGLAEITLNKIIDFYGFDNIIAGKYVGLPSGVGEVTLQKFTGAILENIKIADKFISDSRYNYTEVPRSNSGVKTEVKGYIVVTGSLNYGSRSKFLDFAKDNGWESKGGISKGVTYLINNDINSTSSKNKKAKELGIKIISEDEFMKMIKSESNAIDVMDM